jgi:uncharacterized protein
MTNFIIRYRWLITGFCFLLGVGFASMIPSAKTDPEIRNYVPTTMSSRIETDKIENEFGVQDMVIVLFTDTAIVTPGNLHRIKDIDRGISKITGVSSRISPFTLKTIKGEEGFLTADPLIKKIPDDSSGTLKLKEDVLNNRFAKDVVFSSDFTAASITATINNSEGERLTLNKVDSVINSSPGKAQVLTGGLPYIRRFIMKDVQKDAIIIVPFALLIMLLILKITLGDWRSVFMPFSVVVLSTAVSMGLIPLLGWKISIISLLVPIILVAVANNYGIYMVARNQELEAQGPGSPRDMITKLTGSLNMPILFSGLTTIAGILGLLTHSIIPARQVGILSAIGVTIALGMSLLLIPALIYMRGSHPGRKKSKKVNTKWFDWFTGKLSGLIIRYPGRILIVSVAVTALISLGIVFLRTDTNQEHLFPKNHPVRLASGIINRSFGGSQTISVMVSGDIKSPDVLRGIDNMTVKVEGLDGVGTVFSISQVVREMSKAVYTSNEEQYDHIPATRDGVAQLFELYNMSGDQGDFSQLMNLDNSKAHILIRLSNPDNRVIKSVLAEIEKAKPLIPAEITIGGYAVIMSDFAVSVIKGQVSSLIFAILTVFILLAIIFRSFKGGLIGSIPLTASIFIVFGFMGITGIALDAATALLSSIMIGVGVDFTIQYMWCFNSELRKGLTYEEATGSSLQTIGRSIIINGFSVMAGFSALMFSGFTSIRFFGYLVFISIGSCLIGAILVIPAFLVYFRPSFIEKDLNKRKNRKYEKETNLINVPSAAFTGISTTA